MCFIFAFFNNFDYFFQVHYVWILTFLLPFNIDSTRTCSQYLMPLIAE